MSRRRILAGILAALLLAGCAYGVLLGFGAFSTATDYRPVPPGHQEIVFFAPATSGDSWERLIAAVDALPEEVAKSTAGQPRLRVSKTSAFTDLTADVPEICLWFEGHENARLWIRWYKLSAEFSTEKWISRLATRPTPPLAIIGGDTSYRALILAQALENQRSSWHGPPPLLFITTATVDRYVPNDIPNVSTTDERWPKLMDIYKSRSFRFSFTNSRMAAAVLDFVRTHDELWPHTIFAADVTAAVAGPGAAAAGGPELLATHLYTLKWDDDTFSADLADRFGQVFLSKFPWGQVSPNQIEYSVGDFYQPNPREAFVAGQIIPELAAARDRPQLMLLPANADRARRFLRTVIRMSPQRDWKNLVVITGDSLSLNTVYRDGQVAWNVLDLPVPLVLFSHRNPVSEDAGFKEDSVSGRTGTEELLLYRDILQTALLTAYDNDKLTASSDVVARGLRELVWVNGLIQEPKKDDHALRLFGGDGNRNDGTGEHIVVLSPQGRGPLVLATITVWSLEHGLRNGGDWRLVRTLQVRYDALAN